MTMRKSLSTAAIALAVAFAAPAYAAGDSGAANSGKSPAAEQTQAKPDTGTPGASMGTSGAVATGVTITSEDEGAAVRTADGEEIGEIEKVVSKSGQADKVIISHGGFIGLGEKKAEVEASKLSRAEGEQDGFTLNMTRDQVAQLPEAQASDLGDSPNASPGTGGAMGTPGTGGAMGTPGAGSAPSAAPDGAAGGMSGGTATPTDKPVD